MIHPKETSEYCGSPIADSNGNVIPFLFYYCKSFHILDSLFKLVVVSCANSSWLVDVNAMIFLEKKNLDTLQSSK